MEVIHPADGAHREHEHETLVLLTGAALMVLGTGLMLSTAAGRRILRGVGIGSVLEASAPDFVRFLRMRAM
jgi:hypothetical protein